MTNMKEAGRESALEFFFETLAQTAERRLPNGEIELVYGKPSRMFSVEAALHGLRSLTLQGK